MNLRVSSRPVAVAAASATTVAVLGALMTDTGPWYLALKQPDWKPPDSLFGPAWTLIFALIAYAGVTAWRETPTKSRRQSLLLLFTINGFLNVLWSLLYFRLRRPDWALLEVFFLWGSVLALILVVRRYSPRASLLLAPYLLWISFAGILNWVTVVLNGPF